MAEVHEYGQKMAAKRLQGIQTATIIKQNNDNSYNYNKERI